VWGIIGYMFFLLFLPFAKNKDAGNKRVWTLLFLIATGFTLYSIILAFISTFYIHSYCIMCLVLYAVNLLLLFYTHMIRSRFKSSGLIDGFKKDIHFLKAKRLSVIGIFAPFFSVVILLLLFFPTYWQFAPPVLLAKIDSGITKDGHPWIGAQNPELIITEYTDYKCFQCKKMHFFLRQLIAKHPGKIRLVHRNFPMDHAVNPIVKEPFHVGSGKMALMAIYATSQNKFWQMNDLLFEMAREGNVIDLRELAARLGMDPKILARSVNDPAARRLLQHDILSALKLQIIGTPAFVINENVYMAHIPPEIIRTALDD
jgi:protein-disulfide isomerase